MRRGTALPGPRQQGDSADQLLRPIPDAPSIVESRPGAECFYFCDWLGIIEAGGPPDSIPTERSEPGSCGVRPQKSPAAHTVAFLMLFLNRGSTDHDINGFQ